jgi:spermidine/putrescine ABC transporter ATP-binding subunit
MIDVELRNVTKSFGDVTAVDDVSLQVKQGEFLTLLGPSGCGKTTTLRIVAGLESATEGQVLIRGQEVSHQPPYRRDMSLMFQDYALFPHKDIYDNVAFGLKYRKVPEGARRNLVEEILDLVHLPGIEDRYPGQLSGGQQQRVALARALVVNPAVLLLDEPLSNLDLKLREQMRVELKQIQEQVGITFVFVTHDQEEALTLSDTIAIMEAGKVVQVGSPRQVYERPQTKFVARFIGQSNILEGRVRRSGSNEIEFETDNGLGLTVSLASQIPTGERLAIQIRAERVHVYSAVDKAKESLTFPGEVDRTIYVGSVIQYHVRLEGGDMFLATQPSTGGMPLVRKTPVVIGFNREDCVVLRGAT